MKKIKVLQFTITNEKGGRTQYILNNLRFIDKSRFQFDFVTFSRKIDYEAELISQGCRIHYISKYPEENEAQFIREFKSVLADNYDVIHIHTSYWRGFIVEKLAREAHVPLIIVHSHNTGCSFSKDSKGDDLDRAEHMRIRSLLEPDMADMYIACSKEASEWLYGDRIQQDKVIILKNAIDTAKFAFNPDIRSDYRNRLNITDKFVLGNVGRMVYQKNHEFLIEVFEAVSRDITDSVLLLAGDGERRKELEAMIEKKGLRERVIILGRRDDVNCLMQAMDMFLLPSRFEGFPIVLVEAQTAGLPCITSDNVSEEIKITPLITHCALVKELWVNLIKRQYVMIKESANENYIRYDRSKEITDAGFDIREQIKILESLYTVKKDMV